MYGTACLFGHLRGTQSVSEIMTQAVVTFDDLTGEIHENQKTDFHFFISPIHADIDNRSIVEATSSRQHLHIP